MKNRIIRVRNEFINACDYLEYVAKYRKINIYEYYSEIFTYSLSKIFTNGFNYYIEPYKPRRKPKGFPMKLDVSEKIDIAYGLYKDKYYEKYSQKLYVADFVEILIYIYIINEFDDDLVDKLKSDFKITEQMLIEKN